MKNLLKITLTAAVGLLLMSSCKKEEAITLTETEKEITATEMANPENPYDNEGKIHNRFLEYFITNVGDANKIDQDRLNMIYEGFATANKMQYGQDETGHFNELVGMYVKLKAGKPDFIENASKQYPDWRELLNSTGPYNPNQIASPRDPASGLPTGKRMRMYIQDVKNEETNILKNKELNDEQKAVYLKYFSVARHSAGYWNNVINIEKEKSPYYKSIMDAQNQPAALCATCDIIGADASGAVVGAIFGGPVGAGVGAGIASAAAAIEIFWW